MGSAVIIEASISFLDLDDPNLISWGQIILGAQLYHRFWWMPLTRGHNSENSKCLD